MNLRRPNANEVTNTFNRSRNVVPMSGIGTGCLDGCKGGCETWLASFRGREVLYPARFGEITAGADKNYPVDYSHLNIQGYTVGAEGLPEGIESLPESIGEAIAETERSTIVRQALGNHVFDHLIELKKKEWDDYRTHLSQYEIDRYLPIL